MEYHIKIFIITQVVGNLFLCLPTYWLGHQSTCDYKFCIKQNKVPVTDELWVAPSENLTFPEVHSPLYLKELAKYEAFVYSALLDLAENQSRLFQPALLVKIEGYLHNYEKDREFVRTKTYSTSTTEDLALVVSQNSVLTLNLIWRFSNELSEVVDLMKTQPYNWRVKEGQGKAFIEDLQAIAKWPNKWTTEAAFTAFLRIQMIHNTKVTELSAGQILGVHVAPPMNMSLMFALGSFARQKKMYTLAVPWLELARDTLILEKDRSMQISSKVTMTDVKVQLRGAMKDHDKEHPGSEELRRRHWDHYFYRDKLIYENGTLVERRYPMRELDWAQYRRLNFTFNDLNYWSLCSGENHQTEKEKAELSCWYDRTSSPALTIFPIKKELLSQTPYILRIYDIIGKSATDAIFEPWKQKMKRSRIIKYASTANDANPIQPVTESRTSVGIYLQEPQHKLSNLIEVAIGLLDVNSNSESSEDYFLTSYSFGGHYECHLDAFEDERLEMTLSGNRIATVMLYLENTQIGGLTAFPQAGIATEPIKGSAIFWYNLKLNGTADHATYHCACPVVLGHKTIATKIIQSKNQFRLRPCGLNQYE